MKLSRERAFTAKFILFMFVLILTFCTFILLSNNIFEIDSNKIAVIGGNVTFIEKNDFPIIIIDAGHGGEDGGAVSDSGTLEKNINLDIANKIEYLFKLSNLDVKMTRKDDKMLYLSGQESRKKYNDINNRIKFANSFDNAILISVHQNKFPIKKYSGFQVYCSKNNPESKILGEFMQNTVIENLQPENTRKIKIAENIMLLDNLDIPAVIAECGFLSNNYEAELLEKDEYKNKIAFLIYAAILRYLQ